MVEQDNLCNVPGLPLRFTNNAKSKEDFVASSKAIDDFQMICQKKKIPSFIKSISRRFYVVRYHIDEVVSFNAISVSRNGHECVT